MFQVPATINDAPGSSQKCFHCGLRNFADTTQCKRCKSDLSLPLNASKKDKQRGKSGELNRVTFSSAWISLAALVVVLLAVILFYTRQSATGTLEVGGAAAVSQSLSTTGAGQPEPNSKEQNASSRAVATQILADLKRFRDATESGMDHDEYDKKLNGLKTVLNDRLPSFVGTDPGDQIFRQEVAAVLREYTAAGNWWKTTITHNTVFTETDRDERTQKNFESARTHLTNAEKAVVR